MKCRQLLFGICNIRGSYDSSISLVILASCWWITDVN
ncbi:unnamed protein product [Psylliodes chrysocephalus]|uniref:Uncharacterized protein n=1 Tax=Psylliodes chrysocephalus TaxID=3402493 RepID=A0A9P0D6L6_9CUCU|nr:unnamed protein product [Psylliodes chrysocephala]